MRTVRRSFLTSATSLRSRRCWCCRRHWPRDDPSRLSRAWLSSPGLLHKKGGHLPPFFFTREDSSASLCYTQPLHETPFGPANLFAVCPGSPECTGVPTAARSAGARRQGPAVLDQHVQRPAFE